MTGVLFIARLGSTRLQNKHLIEVGERSLFEWLIRRYLYEFENEVNDGTVKLIVATSHLPENKKFEKLLNHLPVEVFYGNDENIPLRQVECGEHYRLENIISIDGDDILCSKHAARKIYEKLHSRACELVKSIGLPFGMNVMGYSLDFLKAAVAEHKGKLETGWGRIFDSNLMQEILLGNYTNSDDLRFTLDYELDANFFGVVLNNLKEDIIGMSDEQLIQLVQKNQWNNINASLSESYWKNFNQQKNAETNPND